MVDKLISVIIPCYNVEKYVSKCLDSIINQTYKNLEIICVNDGSTDNTLSILEEYGKRDKRIKLINQKNGGLSAARNAGIDIATSEYITFVDSDDWIELNTYEVAISKMTDDVDFVCWGVRVVNTDNLTGVPLLRFNFRKFSLPDGKLKMSFALFKDFFDNITVWNKLYKKSILDKYNIRFPVGQLSEDISFNYLYFCHTDKFYNISAKFYNYQQLKNSIRAKMKSKKSYIYGIPELTNLYLIHRIFIENNCWRDVKPVFVDCIFSILFKDAVNSFSPFNKVCDLFRQLVIDCGISTYSNMIVSLLIKKDYKKLKDVCILPSLNPHFISIIVPVYNKELYLTRCLDSLINQTYKDIEIICVDDCSTDSSLFILKKYARIDDRIKVFKNDKNMGVAYTRQKGLDLSISDYIMWCDADDSYELNACEEMIKAMLKHKVDVVECPFNYFDNILVKSRRDFQFKGDLCRIGKSNVDLFVLRWCYKSLWGHIYKRSIIELNKIKFFDELRCKYEDWIFTYLYMLQAKSIYFLNKRLYNYYVVVDSLLDQNLTESVRLAWGEFVYFKYVIDFVREYNWKDKFWICNEISYRLLFDSLLTSGDYLSFISSNLVYCISNSYLSSLPSKYFPQKMNVVFAADDSCIEKLCLTIASVLKHSVKEDGFDFYILDCGISSKNKDRVEKLKSIKKCYIEFVNIDKELFSMLSVSEENRILYAKYLLPVLKTEVSKCLYLDCNVIIRKSLRKLYNTNLDDNYVLMVPNTGIFLINNNKWIDDDIFQKLINISEKLNDKEIIDCLFKNRVKIFDNIKDLKEIFYLGDDCLTDEFKKDCIDCLKQTPFKKNAEKHLKKIMKLILEQ